MQGVDCGARSTLAADPGGTIDCGGCTLPRPAAAARRTSAASRCALRWPGDCSTVDECCDADSVPTISAPQGSSKCLPGRGRLLGPVRLCGFGRCDGVCWTPLSEERARSTTLLLPHALWWRRLLPPGRRRRFCVSHSDCCGLLCNGGFRVCEDPCFTGETLRCPRSGRPTGDPHHRGRRPRLGRKDEKTGELSLQAVTKTMSRETAALRLVRSAARRSATDIPSSGWRTRWTGRRDRGGRRVGDEDGSVAVVASTKRATGWTSCRIAVDEAARL